MGHGVGHHIDISIHALREEGDAGVFSQIVDLGVFLSTPSVRRATRPAFRTSESNGTFLSTPSARRATCKALAYAAKLDKFLSTPSARRATTAL